MKEAVITMGSIVTLKEGCARRTGREDVIIEYIPEAIIDEEEAYVSSSELFEVDGRQVWCAYLTGGIPVSCIESVTGELPLVELVETGYIGSRERAGFEIFTREYLEGMLIEGDFEPVRIMID